MKTSVVMQRPMGDFTVKQRTKDGMFNATSLLKQWNLSSGQQKQIIHFTDNKSTKEFINALENEADIKQRNSVLIKSRGKNGGTWMNPLLFIDFAMWLNPAFKVQVLRFVYDQLIEHRHLAGDKYNTLTAALVKLEFQNYPLMAKGLNYIVFNKHYKGIRQNASKEQLCELARLQEQFAFAINMGYIKTFTQLMKELRRAWNIKYNPINK